MSLITKQNQLKEICDLIHQHKITAIDTEFIRENTYLPILCLIQINVAGKCYAVDPLSELDLEPFLEIISSPKITKIFHSARQDLEILLLNFPNKVSPKLIFDTQIMAALCGLGHTVSYSNLAKDLLGEEVCKDLQRSDWQKRPLHQDQIEYAKTDVLHLPEIYQILQDKLTKAKKTIWAQEEMDLNIQKALSEDDLCKKFSLTNKPQIYQENINLLVKWRDQTAKQYNVPRTFVLRDEVLEKISATNPSDIETLEQFNIKTRITNADFKQQFLTEILNLLISKPITKQPIIKQQKIIFRLTEPQKELYQKARILLQTQSQTHQISPELIINQINLQHLISGNKLINEILAGWRFEVFGVELERFIREERVEDLFVNHKA